MVSRATARPGPPARQAGSALIVALVFLIILTILGLSSMSTSRLELRMANNTQFADLAFQAAESGIDLMLATPALKTKLSTDPNDPSPYTATYTLGPQTATAVSRYVTAGLAPGYSIGTPALHYRLQSTGTAAGGGEAQHIQGFYIIGAKAG
jgi:hypothetical protein